MLGCKQTAKFAQPRSPSEVTDAPQGAAFIAGRDPLRCILYDFQFMAFGDRHDLVHLTGDARIADSGYHSGARGNRGLDQILIQVQSILADVYKNRDAPMNRRCAGRAARGGQFKPLLCMCGQDGDGTGPELGRILAAIGCLG